MSHADRTVVERAVLRLARWYDEAAADERDETADVLSRRTDETRRRLELLRRSALSAGRRLAR